MEGLSTQRRKTECLPLLSTIEDEAHDPMAKAAATIVKKLVLPVHPFTTTQIPTAMNAPPAI